MRSLLLLVPCLICSLLRGQEFTSFNITHAQGLPSNTVYDLFQDSKGFLWVATENGLARYNGASFRRYHNPDVRSTAVSGISEDSNGRIWLHNFFGEILYVEGDTLKKLTSWEERYQQGFPIITNLGDTLLISSTSDLYAYVPGSGLWERFVGPRAGATFGHHIADARSAPWLVTADNDFTFVEPLTRRGAPPLVKLDNRKFRLHQNVSRLFAWRESLWLFDQVGHILLELKDGEATIRDKDFGSSLASARTINVIGDSLLFLGPSGASLLDKQGRWRNLLAGKNASTAVRDKEGALWIATLNEGLFYFPSTHSMVYPKSNSGIYSKLACDTLRRTVFAGTQRGDVDLFSVSGDKRNVLRAVENKEVQSLLVDAVGGHLFVYTNKLRAYELATLKPAGEFGSAATKSIARTNNQVALATSAGLHLLSPPPFRDHVGLFNSLRLTSVAFEEPSNLLWVGTQKGLYTYDLTYGKTKQWQSDSSQVSPGVSRLQVLTNGQIAVGTLTNGLMLLKGDRVEWHFTSHNGLPSDKITALAESQGILWVGTDRGIVRLNTASGEHFTLDHTKGLLSEEVIDLLHNGNSLWVAHTDGLQVFSSLPEPNRQRPRLFLQHATTGGMPLSSMVNGIALTPASQQLALEFDVANSLKSQGTTRIRFRIAELDGEQWHETTLKNPVVNYMTLPYGDFVFEAEALNEDGAASDVLRIPLAVQAPFWKQWWFAPLLIAMVSFVAAWLIYLGVRRANRLSRDKIEKLNRENELRVAQLTSLRSQMNPHFIFNTMSLIQGKALNGLGEEASRTIEDFSTLMRRVLDYSGKETITLQEETGLLQSYLAIEKDRFDGMLDYEVYVDRAASEELLRIPSLLTQPFVENALRHGLMHRQGAKKLSVRFTLDSDILTIVIDDNGIGRRASAEFNRLRSKDHQSFGMSASQRRIELLNATRRTKILMNIIDKEDTYGMPGGTTVIINLPLYDEGK